MANIEKIVLPDNTEYDVKDAGALPKTASSTDPLTGDLYLDAPASTARIIYLRQGGTPKAKIQLTDTGSVNFCNTNDDGTAKAGVQVTSTSSPMLFSNGTSVFIRPNGSGSTSGQVYFDTSGWGNGFGFHAATGNTNVSSTIERVGDMFFYRRAAISGGSMTAGTFKTVDQIASSAWYPGAEVNTGFAIGYNSGQHTPLRYGKVRVTATGAIQVSPSADLTACDWTVIAMWRNPSFTG